MTDTATLPAIQTLTGAQQKAQANFRANIAAMVKIQPNLAHQLASASSDVQWIFARDGYLTAQTADGWHSGCSVPMRAARELLKKLELTGTVGCFLKPLHAAQIRAGFEKLTPAEALIAVVPDFSALHIMLHCDDFTAEISAGRLFFVGGENWPRQLTEFFEQNTGLPLPQQFLRTALLDEENMAALSGEAQTIISRETARRPELLAQILDRGANRSSNSRVLILAGSRVQVDDLSNIALRAAIGDAADEKFTTLDSDHPLSASPLALAQSAADADAVVAANVFRSDLSGLTGQKTEWITWVTRGRIVQADPQYPSDAILLADPTWRQSALDAGWPAQRIQIAGWPRIVPMPEKPSRVSGTIGLVTDTQPIQVPKRVKELSSQQLLWEMIEDELCNRPWSLGADPLQYLTSRMKRFNISDEGFDTGVFFERLIAPAYKAGLARFLLHSGFRIALFGRGWKELPEFQAIARGPIENVDDLAEIVKSCDILLEPFPGCFGAAEALALPIICPRGNSPGALKSGFHRALHLKPEVASAGLTPLNKNVIRSLL